MIITRLILVSEVLRKRSTAAKFQVVVEKEEFLMPGLVWVRMRGVVTILYWRGACLGGSGAGNFQSE